MRMSEKFNYDIAQKLNEGDVLAFRLQYGPRYLFTAKDNTAPHILSTEILRYELHHAVFSKIFFVHILLLW